MTLRSILVRFLLASASLLIVIPSAHAQSGPLLPDVVTIADFEAGLDSRATLTRSGDLQIAGPWYAWETPPTPNGNDINYWDVTSDGDNQNEYADYLLSIPPQDWRRFTTLYIRYWMTSTTSTRAFDLYVRDTDAGFIYLGAYQGDEGTFRVDLRPAINRDQVHQILIRVPESYFGALGMAGQRIRVHLYDIKVATPTVTVANFEAGVDARSRLTQSGNLQIGGPWYAWENPPTPAGDDINYWDVISDGDSQNEYADYTLTFTPQNWSRFTTLNIRYWMTSPTSYRAFDLYIHDVDGGYKYLGWYQGDQGTFKANITQATNRDQVDQILIRTHESHFGAVGVAGQRLRVHLYDISLSTAGRFSAWSSAWTSNSYGIPLQTFSLNAAQARQFAPYDANSTVLAFAQNNPGQLYIHGDEPNTPLNGCQSPSQYAQSFRAFVLAVRNVDPTARFSPAGFAPGTSCSPAIVGTAYAQQFWNAYVSLYGELPPVYEWRFHLFSFSTDLTGWKNVVQSYADWAVQHNAPLLLGSYGFPGLPASTNVLQAEREMLEFIRNNPKIAGAVWWNYDYHSFSNEAHRLTLPNGTLSPEGQVYREQIPF